VPSFIDSKDMIGARI